MEHVRTQGAHQRVHRVRAAEIYVHAGRCFTRTRARGSMTPLGGQPYLDWASGLSVLPYGFSPPRQPSRMMVDTMAGLMRNALWVIRLGQQGCALAAPGFDNNCFGTSSAIRRDAARKVGRYVTLSRRGRACVAGLCGGAQRCDKPEFGVIQV